jgi:hypothetical protein
MSGDPVARAQAILAWAEQDPWKRAEDAQAQVRDLAAGLDPVPDGVLGVGHVLASMADAARFLAGSP